MALPAHLSHYDGLVDLLVEQIVGEIDAQTKTPIEGHDSSTGANHLSSTITTTGSPTTTRIHRCRKLYRKPHP